MSWLNDVKFIDKCNYSVLTNYLIIAYLASICVDIAYIIIENYTYT